MAGWRGQLDILTGRELAVRAGSAGTLLLMLVQAPLIGACLGLAWKGQEAAPQTYLVMSVAALWMGCMNACTAVVSERELLARERMFGLDLRAYLLSKMAVLAVVGAVQAALLLYVQGRLMHLKAGALPLALFFLALSATAAAAAGLGLAVSSFARTAYGAVVTVPVILIPQVVFHEVLLGANIERGASAVIAKLTLTKWCYDALADAHEEVEWLVQLGAHAALAAGLVLCLALAALKLRLDDA